MNNYFFSQRFRVQYSLYVLVPFIVFLGALTVMSCNKNEDDKLSYDNRPFISVKNIGDLVLVQWKHAAQDNCFGSEIYYRTRFGTDTMVIVPSYKITQQLLNFKSENGSFRYRTLYLEDPKSSDTIYSQYETVSDIPKGAYENPVMTCKFNRGGSDLAGRIRDKAGRIIEFDLINDKITLYDGSGRDVGKINEPVKLNKGTQKEMIINGKVGTYVWAWSSNIVGGGQERSGWVDRDSLVSPPALVGKDSPFNQSNPSPPAESSIPLKINANVGTAKLQGLIHRSSDGNIPLAGGNMGTDYGGRYPGPLNYVYLERAVPNVQNGGTSKDSMADSSWFIPALDKYGRQMTETVTMFIGGNENAPVNVTFIYGRPKDSPGNYGWIARANVGEL